MLLALLPSMCPVPENLLVSETGHYDYSSQAAVRTRSASVVALQALRDHGSDLKTGL